MSTSQSSRDERQIKNSDSDYKAEDEGSASDNNKRWPKYKKTPYNLKLTKKQMIENSIKTLIPIGEHIKYENELTIEQYEQLLNVTQANLIEINFKSILGKILQIVDNQNYKIGIYYNNRVIKLIFHLNGIMMPDGKKIQTKEFSGCIKKILQGMLLGRIVRIETGQFDKFGRICCRIYGYLEERITQLYNLHSKNCNQFCINDYLIYNDMGKGMQNKNKCQFSKKDFVSFQQKYQNKVWPVLQHYPFQVYQAMANGGYEEEEDQNQE